jgi:crossover junction endodeoxyribonuclease RuvC
MIRVLGLDLSLTATGFAYSDEVVGTFMTKARGMPRLAEIRDFIVGLVDHIDVVVFEGYAFARPNQAHQLGELGGVVRLALHDRRVPFIDVPPASLKRFATGRGNADKDAMLAAAIRRFDFPGEDNNAADAWLLRAMGLAAYSDWGPVTDYQREALDKVSWPKLDVVERVG